MREGACRDHRRGRAVGEDRGRDDLLGIGRCAQVDAADFAAHDQDHGVGVGGADACRLAERRECCGAADEPQVVALDRGAQAEVSHEPVVGTRGEEPRARCGHDMRDGGCLDIRPRESVTRRPLEERRGLPPVHVVACSRQRREHLPGVRVEEGGGFGGAFRELGEHRVPGVDGRLIERCADQACRQFLDAGLGEEEVAHRGLRQNGGRNGRADAEDVGGHVSE